MKPTKVTIQVFFGRYHFNE